ncbi:hypothetical protein [Winogradskyella sp.]|uniref:hypothetical protein n=1 Tax=Winogradskyella sp. TaxID=1883156 RepID=UPI002635AF5F|nr:hypothetical protein [Winogradskyella sp.]
MQKRNQIFGFLILTLLMSCQYDPYAHKYTIIEPKESDLIGTYAFEKQTIDYDIAEFKDSMNNRIVIPKIGINSNGTYKVVNFPVFENLMNPTFTGLITNTGKWNKTTIGAVRDETGELKNIWGMYFDQLPEASKYMGLMNKEYPYELIFVFGDPDEGNVMIFKKE